MSIFNLFRGQFIDIVEWPDESPQVLVHRFERFHHEIKMGAKLIVRPGQMAVFVNEGRIADHFMPGTYTLKTANLPILTTLLSLPYNFESPFKAEVYFIRTTEQLNRKWGTATPVMMRDSNFGMVRLRARGYFSYKIGTDNELLSRFVGARAEFTCEDLEGQVKAKVVSEFSDALGELKIPALELASMYNEISHTMRRDLAPHFSGLGLEVLDFAVENISLPDEVNAVLDKRTGLGALADVMQPYTQMQAADAMRAAADNPGGAGNMMGMFVGAQLANTTNQTAGQTAGQTAAAPPPLPPEINFFVAVNGQQTGPFVLAQLRAQALAGSFTRDQLVWTQGMAGWQPAGTVAELQALFAAVPPPLS